jgi:protein-tyrosine phosphatase
VIDLHSHVLPGIDDGPQTVEGSVALARAAAATGIRTLVATPHVSWRYPNDADTISRLVSELNTRLSSEEIALDVLCGGEIAMTRAMDMEPGQLPRLGLGGGPWLLVEPPFTAVVAGLDSILMDLQRQGHRILLAHPERCPAFHRDPRMLESLVRAGVLTSITAGSFVGRFGSEVRRFALHLASEGLIHNVASDMHDLTRRPPGIAQELKQAGLGALTDWLTQAVPAAILDDQEIPSRPAVIVKDTSQTRRQWWRRKAG